MLFEENTKEEKERLSKSLYENFLSHVTDDEAMNEEIEEGRLFEYRNAIDTDDAATENTKRKKSIHTSKLMSCLTTPQKKVAML